MSQSGSPPFWRDPPPATLFTNGPDGADADKAGELLQEMGRRQSKKDDDDDDDDVDIATAKVSPQVSEEFQKLKRSNDKNRLLRYIIFKLSDDYSEIEVEHAEPDSDWENFREKLLNATSKSKTGAVGKGPRYAVYDFGFKYDGREINKIILIAWSPDDAGVHPKMIYAASKEALKRSLEGFAYEIQANDSDDLEHASILSAVLAKMNA